MPEFIWELPAVRPAPDESVEVGDGVIDHAEGAVNRLAIQFRKPKIEAFVRALCAQMQPLEEAFIALYTQRTIDNAIGAQLDLLGKIVGQEQVDVEDVVYRSLIRARIRANKSSGMGNQILLIARLVLTDYAAQEDVVAAGVMRLRIRNYGHAAYVLQVEDMDVPWELAQLLAEDFLRVVTADGVRFRLDFVVQQDPDLDHYTTAFRYGTVADPGSGVGGYGSITDATVGGELAAGIE